MGTRSYVPLCLIPVADLISGAAQARRLAIAFSRDPVTALSLVHLADEMDAEISRQSRLG